MAAKNTVKTLVFTLVVGFGFMLALGLLPSEDTQGNIRVKSNYTVTDDFIPPFPVKDDYTVTDDIRVLKGDSFRDDYTVTDDFIPPFPVKEEYMR